MDGITFDRISDEQRLEGDKVVPYITATVRIDDKGPFFYRAKRTENWADEMKAWGEKQAAQVRALTS
jgi:hypothetical protein